MGGDHLPLRNFPHLQESSHHTWWTVWVHDWCLKNLSTFQWKMLKERFKQLISMNYQSCNVRMENVWNIWAQLTSELCAWLSRYELSQFSGEPLLWQCPAGEPDTHSTNSQLSSSESCDLISLRLKLCLTQSQNAQAFPQKPNATT